MIDFFEILMQNHEHFVHKNIFFKAFLLKGILKVLHA